jgi:pSer/pThr/pTyr-binding forkhead associated (FHA) protein
MKLFLKACGVPDAFRLKIEDRTRSDTLERTYSHPFALIGRNPDTDLTLDHWQVSRRHAYIQILHGRLFCLDLGSRTGTLWEGRPSRSKWLSLRQTVHVGPFRIACESYDPSAPPEDEGGEVLPPPTAGLPGARLEPIDDPSLGVWQMEEAIALIGRSPGCEIRLPDPSLSKFHASLVRTTLGVWVVDLLGTSGIQVNRKRLRCSRLADGDELAIGQHRFRLFYDDPQAFDGIIDEAPIGFAGSELAVRNNGGWLATQGQPQGPWEGMAQPPALPYGTGGVPESVMMVQAMLAPMLNQFAMMQQQMFEQFHQTMIAMIQSMQVVNRDRMELIQKELNEVHRLTRELHSLQVEASRPKETPPAPAPPIVPPAGPVRVVGSSVTPPPPPPEPTRPAARPAAPPKSERAIPKQSHVDVHATLHQRINNLQSERQTRWQKILGMVGKHSDERA